MACLHTHIFMLHLVDLVVGGKADLLYGTGKRVLPEPAVWLFLHFLKVKSHFAFTGCLVKGTFGAEDLLCGNGLLRCVQLIRCLIRAADIFL